MKLSSLRPAYISARLSQRAFWRRHPDAPWLAQSAILFLESWLKTTDRGIEWGSGRSTAWIGQRVAHLISVEHYKPWYERVSGDIERLGLKNKVDYRLVACEVAESVAVPDPDSHPYADVALELSDNSLDFALVDGRMRSTCMCRAIPKLRPGGLLILDNANRYVPNLTRLGYSTITEPCSEPRGPKWKKLLEGIADWRPIHMSDRIFDTRAWIKPH
ncbi:MAG: hypothetical protein WCI73_10960 [Phycisphaerae bacterium]